MLKRSLKSLLWASLGHSVIITLGMTALFAILTPWMDFMQGYSLGAVLAIAGIWGAMAVSKAPADTLAILGETRAKGALAEHALGVVVLLDVIVLILFAIALMFGQAAVTGVPVSIHVFEKLGLELVASVAAGTTFGLVIAFYFWAIDKERVLFTVAAAYGITAFCAYFHYDTLLVFVVAGFVVMNLTKEGHQLIETTESVAAAVMVVFFATAGAQLNLGALEVYGPLALALAFGRIGFTWLGCQLGHRMAKDAPVVKRYAFTSFISQAGVTIGLATIAAEALGEVGVGISTLVIAVIGVNELIGPVAFKIGLARAAAEEPHENTAASHDERAHERPVALGEKLARLGDESLTLDVQEHDGNLEAFLLLDAEGTPLEATLSLTPEGEGVRLGFAAKLSGELPFTATLKPETGLVALVKRMSELKLGDKVLDDTFVIDASEAARPVLKQLRAPLLTLAETLCEIELKSDRLSVLTPVVDATQLDAERVARAAVELWQGLNRAERAHRAKARIRTQAPKR